jgi:hypothetical protein
VLAVNAKIPCWDACFANTLIQDIETAELIVVNDCNLYSELVADIRFVVDGSDVTDKISEQSKRVILQARLKRS